MDKQIHLSTDLFSASYCFYSHLSTRKQFMVMQHGEMIPERMRALLATSGFGWRLSAGEVWASQRDRGQRPFTGCMRPAQYVSTWATRTERLCMRRQQRGPNCVIIRSNYSIMWHKPVKSFSGSINTPWNCIRTRLLSANTKLEAKWVWLANIM